MNLADMTPEQWEAWREAARQFVSAFCDSIADGPPPHKPEPTPDGEPEPEP